MKDLTMQEYAQALMSKKGREEIVHKLKELVDSDGWKIISLYLNQQRDGLQLEMDDINKDMSMDQLQKIRIRLYYIKDLLAMPETFIKELSEMSDDQEVPSDIY